MATEQEIETMRQRVATLEAAETERTKAGAVARELGRYELASPGAAEQLAALILPRVQITKLSDGRDIVHSPDYTPLDAVVASALQTPQYAHFLKPRAPATPEPAQPGSPALRPAAATAGNPPAANQPFQLEGESLGAAIIRRATAQSAERGDPRLDPTQPLALGWRNMPRQ
jgi:hypothetical protein